jgi:hypothetical protein
MKSMKTAIFIPNPLLGAMEHLGEKLGISRSQLIQRPLEEFVQSHDDNGVTEALNKVYAAEKRQAKLDPILERLQAASIPEEEWQGNRRQDRRFTSRSPSQAIRVERNSLSCRRSRVHRMTTGAAMCK